MVNRMIRLSEVSYVYLYHVCETVFP